MGVTMGLNRTAALLTLAAAFVAIAAPAGAAPAALTPNAYGQVFAGQEECLRCHGATTGRWQTGTYRDTVHSQFVTDVQKNPAALVPVESKWPSPTFGSGGQSFGASDMMWILGSSHQDRQYVTKYINDGPATLATGMTLPKANAPEDDYRSTANLKWKKGGYWDASAANPPNANRTYFQGCGGCHFVGVTRPTDKAYTMANGATVSPTTPTSYGDFGIQCETCHGTGQASPNHWGAGVSVNRTKSTLRSQTCGQCHVNGTAKEKNFAGGTFSSPNGFTPDRKLTDFFNIRGVEFIKTSPGATPPAIPTTNAQFYPNGSTKAMTHSHYNEFMLTGHARSLRYSNGSLWSEYAQDECLPCHSGEGFLKSIGYGKDTLNDVVVTASNLKNDVLNIECAVCHQTHGRSGEPLGLRLSAEELCGKCHNGHLTPGAEAVPGTEMHHPQQEMRSGYGLIGVPRPAEAFMDDTTCVDCHMPRTYIGRASHSFKVMLPGDAESWKVVEGGDSCTPCHGGTSRSNLQAKIDSWQSSTEGGIAAANSRILAATKRRASSSATGKSLIAKARTNVAYVESDGSAGVHNYPYAKAGLATAERFARLVGARSTALKSTRFDRRSRTAWVFNTVYFGDGARAAGERVTIQARTAGSKKWKKVATVTSQDNGGTSLRVKPRKTTYYRAIWTPEPGATFVSASTKVKR